MRTLLRPYEGTQPYIFVSYAHKNDAAVLEIIGALQSRGFRVWYDEGIEAGSEWPESIASHLSELRALTKLQDITLSHCTRRELLIPLHKSSLTRVTLVDCDLRGDFFHSFDRERAITSLTLIRCELDSTSGLDGFTGLTELTLRDVSGALDWSALGSLPLQTVTTDAMQADAIRSSGTTATVTVTD